MITSWGISGAIKDPVGEGRQKIVMPFGNEAEIFSKPKVSVKGGWYLLIRQPEPHAEDSENVRLLCKAIKNPQQKRLSAGAFRDTDKCTALQQESAGISCRNLPLV